MDRKAVGKNGEDFVAVYLTEQGMQVVARNYYSRYGEIDLIARDGDTMAFIEVKTRKGVQYGVAAEAVGMVKQRKLIKTAYCYIMENDLDGYNFRFDIAQVYYKTGSMEIEYIKNAFEVNEV